MSQLYLNDYFRPGGSEPYSFTVHAIPWEGTKPYSVSFKILGGKYYSRMPSTGGAPTWSFPIGSRPMIEDFLRRSAGTDGSGLEELAEEILREYGRESPSEGISKSYPEVQQKKEVSRTPPRSEAKEVKTVPSTVTFPAHFLAADGHHYQVAIYTVPLPRVGDLLKLSGEHGSNTFRITSVKEEAPVDSFRIRSAAGEDIEFNVELRRGTFVVVGLAERHKIEWM